MSDSTPNRAEPNRLSGETSPYLLQHAYNPVDWYPWGEEAIARARETDRPIFLSIGYSACHWCHVMEHESFENETIAALMNEHFINIKVDREERPDLDQIYMTAVQLMTGHGGWPMSVFLGPDLKPFFGGTYWPPEQRMRMPGFRDILQKVHEAWQDRRVELTNSAEQLTAAIVQNTRPAESQAGLDESLLSSALNDLKQATDRTYGGFGGAPKFPHPMDIRLLLRLWKRTGDEEALEITKLTLDRMAAGGIYDQLGGGFHRYSTDARWLAPHFEKMLYDNALLVSTYLEGYQATGDENYARVVRETLDYVLREMTQPEGGFYSTQDADSEGVEGKFFVWTEAEIIEILGEDDARIFGRIYDASPAGNWEGRIILNRVFRDEDGAELLKMPVEELQNTLEHCRQRLFTARKRRIAPGRDDKVLTSWNGLMIAAMAQAAQVLGDDRYATAAREAADFVLANMREPDGRLLHSFKDGRARFNAYLDDYACLIDGLVDVYQATFDAQYLQSALELAERMRQQFHDASAGAFFYTSVDHEQLIARSKDSQDNATPSGNGMAATALLKLSRLCGNTAWEDLAVSTLELLSGQMSRLSMASGQSLIALDFLLGPAPEVVIVDGDKDGETEEILRTLHGRFLPNKVVAHRQRDVDDEALPAVLKVLLQGKLARDGAATVYLCELGHCGEPVSAGELGGRL